MYKAQRDITLNGVAYKQGDPVPYNAAPDRRMKMLIGRGWLKPTVEETGSDETLVPPQDGTIKFPITIPGTDGNRFTQELNADEIQQIFDLLATSVRELETAVSDINDLNLLAVVDAVDPRKTAKELYAAQAKKILGEGISKKDEKPSTPPGQNPEEENTTTPARDGQGEDIGTNGGKGGDA